MSHDHASPWKGLSWAILAVVVAILFIYGIASLAHIIPWQWETKLATMLNDTSRENDIVQDAKVNALLTKMVKRIYPLKADDKDFDIHVRIMKSDTVNAYTELGGRITILTGLIEQAKSPEEIEGVLAHEIEHVRHRHIMEGLISSLFSFGAVSMIFSDSSSAASEISRMLFTMKFSRSQEREADRGALERLQQAHVNNTGFRNFFERMAKESDDTTAFLSDHPADDERVKMAKEYKNEHTTPVMTAQEWQYFKDNN